MLHSALKNIVAKSIKKVVGLTAFVDNESTIYQVVVIGKSKEGDLIPQTYQSLSSSELLKEWLDKNAANLPVLWGIEGRQVLVKIAESDEELSDTQLMNLILPNAEETDFIINIFYENQRYYCSLIRREVFENLFLELSDLKLNLYQGFVGPIIGLSIRDYLVESKAQSFQFGYYEIGQEEEIIHSFRKNEEKLDLVFNGNYELPHKTLNAFSYATTFFTGISGGLTIIETEESVNSSDEYIHKRIFKPFFYGAITIMLVAFLGNAYFYMDKRQKNEELREKSSSTQLLINTYQKQQAIYQKKDKIAKSLNYSNIGVAWISDQIGQLIPSDISLTGLIIDPVSKNKKKSSPFDQNEIHISGNSTDNNAFGELIGNLSQLDFVDEISYQQYQFNKTKRTGEFLIKLKYKKE